MRQAELKRQFDAAISNVESALEDLSERLNELPGRKKRRRVFDAAGKRLRHTADKITHRLPVERASTLAANSRRTATEHPVTTALAAAVAGYCVWSLLRFANERSARRESRLDHPERYGSTAKAQYPRGEQQTGPETEAWH
ncbi:MAG: hypothetical protein WD448_07095 [Woeseia sp.]